MLMGKGQYDKAIADYNKAIELNPKFTGAYINRGLAYLVPERKPPSLTFASGRRAKQSYKLNFLLELAGKSQAENRSAL